MGIYSSTAANAYADKIKAVYEHLGEIKKVADRLTPVEDLTSFQSQIESLYARLDLLVEASNLITTATPVGEAILTGSVNSIQTLLEIGILPEDLVHESDLEAALAAQWANIEAEFASINGNVGQIGVTVQQLDQYRQSQQTQINGLSTSYQNVFGQLETQQTNLESALSRLTVNEQFSAQTDTRLDTIDQQIASTILGVQASNDIISGHTAELETYHNGVSMNTASIDSLSSSLADLGSSVSANSSAIDLMETSITSLGDDIVAQSQQTTALKASIGGSGNLLPNAGFAVSASGWHIVVAEEDWSASLLEVNAFDTPSEVDALSILGTPSPLGELVVESPAVLIDAEKHYMVSGYPCVDTGTVKLSYKEFDVSGSVVGQGECPATTNHTTNPSFSAYSRTWVKFLPSTDTVKIRLYLTVVGNGSGIVQAALFRPMVEQAWIDQAGPSAWIPNLTGTTDALAEAVESLSVQVSENSGQIEATATANTGLSARLETAESVLAQEMITRSNEDSALTAAIDSLSAQLNDPSLSMVGLSNAYSVLQADVSSQGDTIDSHSTQLTQLSSEVDDLQTGASAQSSATSALSTRVDATEDSISSNASEITSLSATVGTKASASAVSALDVRVSSNEDNITTFKASYTLTLNVNGYVTGFSSVNTGNSSTFTVNADNFRILKPGGGDSLTWNAGILSALKGGHSVKLGPGFGADATKLIFYYGVERSAASCSFANAQVAIDANGRTKLRGVQTTLGGGWLSGGAISTWNASAGSPATATISVAAGNFSTSGVTIAYNASSVNVTGTNGAHTVFYLYYNDPGWAGGTRTLYATTDGNVQFNNPDYILIGSTAVDFPTSGTSSGGGHDPWCVDVLSWVIVRNGNYRALCRAGGVKVGDELLLQNGKWGRVTYSESSVQPRIRVRTESGAQLTCSATAVLATPYGEAAIPDLIDSMVMACTQEHHWYPTRVESLEFRGSGLVQMITCENTFFLASDDCIQFLAHHNMKMDRL